MRGPSTRVPAPLPGRLSDRAEALAARRAQLMQRSALARTAVALDWAVLAGRVERPLDQAVRAIRWLRPAAAALAVLWPLAATLRRGGARAAASPPRGAVAATLRWLPLALRAAPLAARLWRRRQGPPRPAAGPVPSQDR